MVRDTGFWSHFYVGRNGSVKRITQVLCSVKQKIKLCEYLRMLEVVMQRGT